MSKLVQTVFGVPITNKIESLTDMPQLASLRTFEGYVTGEAIQKLAKYEDLGEPEELENKRELEKQIAEKALEVGEGNVYLEIMVNTYQEYFHKYEELQRKNEWISVEDRLPKLYEEVLIFTKSLDKFVAFIWHDVGMSTPIWCNPYVDCEWELSEVTHWMPLPEPPKGE